MHSGRKLKRGLEDVSPLFRREERGVEIKPRVLGGNEVRSVGVFRPEGFRRGSRLGCFLAWQLSETGAPVTVVSLEAPTARPVFSPDRDPEPYHPGVTYRSMAFSRFEKACGRPVPRKEQLGPDSQFLVLEADLSRIPGREKVFSVLDQCLLVLRPTSESIIEAYKLIKSAATFGSGPEYFMLLEEDPAGKIGSFLFERFSDILSRHLGIGIGWLGSLPGKADKTTAYRLPIEPFLQTRGLGNGAPEKFALAEVFSSREVQVLGQAS